MRVGLFTREYPPQVYGGAGVHVDYLSRELARHIEVEVHCWGPQNQDDGDLHVRGAEPWAEITDGTEAKFKGALEAFSLNLTQVKALQGIDVVHTHTWYVSMAGFLAKKLYGVPFVLTTHSLEPLRAWKAEQLGSGYAMSSWMERTAILDADAIIAVSQGTKADIRAAYPDVDPQTHSRYLQRHRSQRISKDRRDPGAHRLWCRSCRSLRALRRPHHAPEGRHASGRRHQLSAAGYASGALRRCA